MDPRSFESLAYVFAYKWKWRPARDRDGSCQFSCLARATANCRQRLLRAANRRSICSIPVLLPVVPALLFLAPSPLSPSRVRAPPNMASTVPVPTPAPASASATPTMPEASTSSSGGSAPLSPTKEIPVFEFTKRKRWADLLVTELNDTIIFVLSEACQVWYCGNAVTELLGWRDEELVDSDLIDLMNGMSPLPPVLSLLPPSRPPPVCVSNRCG